MLEFKVWDGEEANEEVCANRTSSVHVVSFSHPSFSVIWICHTPNFDYVYHTLKSKDSQEINQRKATKLLPTFQLDLLMLFRVIIIRRKAGASS